MKQSNENAYYMKYLVDDYLFCASLFANLTKPLVSNAIPGEQPLCTAGPCRELWRGRCSKYKRGTWNTAFNRAVLLADVCIEMDASVLIQQQMP